MTAAKAKEVKLVSPRRDLWPEAGPRFKHGKKDGLKKIK